MSENNIAASKPNRLSGCWVASNARSGVKQKSKKFLDFDRISRYSGKYRPAWRINQHGGGETTSPSSAFKKGLAVIISVNCVVSYNLRYYFFLYIYIEGSCSCCKKFRKDYRLYYNY